MCRFDGQSQKDKDNYERVWNNLEELYEDALARGESVSVEAPSAANLSERLAALRSETRSG
jgi:hypothetical protein